MGITSTVTSFFVGFEYNISYYNKLKMKKELLMFVLHFCILFITLINLGTQVWDIQNWYNIVNFGLNQLLVINDKETYYCNQMIFRERNFHKFCENQISPWKFISWNTGRSLHAKVYPCKIFRSCSSRHVIQWKINSLI